MKMVLVQSYVGTSANIVAEEKQTLLPTAKSSHHQVANLISFLDKVGPVLVLEKYILQNQRNTFYRFREIYLKAKSSHRQVANIVSFLDKIGPVMAIGNKLASSKLR